MNLRGAQRVGQEDLAVGCMYVCMAGVCPQQP